MEDSNCKELTIQGHAENRKGAKIFIPSSLPILVLKTADSDDPIYSIWLDSKMRLQTDPMLIIEYFLWRTKSEYAISNHYDSHCVWEESDGLTKFDPSDPNNLLPSCASLAFFFSSSNQVIEISSLSPTAMPFADVPEGSFIVRAHTPMSNLFSRLWFNEVDRFTSRDQLSFAYYSGKL
ncbi:Protein of unknown function DUF616 [Dillenia turbinata]|uniref:TOD1/MUCI70 glycosyltransferase-like domain-containing protein n=1 Tax=Dillenia turbinata TaxID=194707 RepID=A0AAN8Z0N3_9MAGN